MRSSHHSFNSSKTIKRHQRYKIFFSSIPIFFITPPSPSLSLSSSSSCHLPTPFSLPLLLLLFFSPLFFSLELILLLFLIYPLSHSSSVLSFLAPSILLCCSLSILPFILSFPFFFVFLFFFLSNSSNSSICYLFLSSMTYNAFRVNISDLGTDLQMDRADFPFSEFGSALECCSTNS